MSDHTIKVAKLGPIEDHPNADRLRIVRMDGYQSCAGGKILEAHPEDLAVFVPPQFMVRDKNSLFEELSGVVTPCRIKTMKLRGVISHGLVLYPLPLGWVEGQEVQDLLGISRWEPETHNQNGTTRTAGSNGIPYPFVSPKYDVESLRKYGRILFEPGEPLAVTEKIHGANGRFTYHDGRMWCGSRSMFKMETDSDLWWRCLRQNLWIETLCKAWPNHIFYGEVYGNVQDMRYGVSGDAVRFRVFDVYDKLRHLYESPISFGWIMRSFQEHCVPFICNLEWDPENSIPTLQELADNTPSQAWEGGTQHYMEGVVVRPLNGPYVNKNGDRRILKLISFPYESRI